MAKRDWNGRYAEENLPWDTAAADANLVAAVEAGTIKPGRALEIGCGTGTHAIWLAQRGFEVVAVDIAPLAIERARAKATKAGVDVRLEVLDILQDPVDADPFDFAFDRGVLHVFDDAQERALFARNVARTLGPGGQWLSLAGSTEGPAREHGPPRRSAADLITAVEPVLEIVELRRSVFDGIAANAFAAWNLRARVREVPAVPSTRR
jgi:SAM-dependent methyltransferase